MKTALIVVGVLVAMVFLIGACGVAWGVGVYNSAITGQNDAKTAWGQVENQYQRRADLVPNLVNTVKGYAAHERGVFEAVTEARSKVSQIKIDPTNATPEQISAFQKSQGELTQALSRLLLVVENYPQLKASENFLALQSQLEGTENRIATERRRYNEVVNTYNKHVQVFPNSLVVSGKFQPLPLFEADEGARKAPKVDFSGPK